MEDYEARIVFLYPIGTRHNLRLGVFFMPDPDRVVRAELKCASELNLVLIAVPLNPVHDA